MNQGKRKLAVAALAVAGLAAWAGPVQAVVYMEPTGSDAGQTLATASATGTNATTVLTAIQGAFNGLNDADLYRITITAAGTFSATTNNAYTNTGTQDTALFLFNASGVAIATNDDAAGGTTTNSTLPAGNALYASLAAGTYFIGISESGNEAINLNSQLLFMGYPGGDTTAVRGAASGVNPTTESTFNSNAFAGGGTGQYEIDLTSTATASAVPEPGTWALVSLASGLTLWTLLRRKNNAPA